VEGYSWPAAGQAAGPPAQPPMAFVSSADFEPIAAVAAAVAAAASEGSDAQVHDEGPKGGHI